MVLSSQKMQNLDFVNFKCVTYTQPIWVSLKIAKPSILLLWRLCVCLSVCGGVLDMRLVALGGMELKLGDRTWPLEAQDHIFEATKPKVKGHPEVWF